jgi:hypothetical protein
VPGQPPLPQPPPLQQVGWWCTMRRHLTMLCMAASISCTRRVPDSPRHDPCMTYVPHDVDPCCMCFTSRVLCK